MRPSHAPGLLVVEDFNGLLVDRSRMRNTIQLCSSLDVNIEHLQILREVNKLSVEDGFFMTETIAAPRTVPQEAQRSWRGRTHSWRVEPVHDPPPAWRTASKKLKKNIT